MADYMDFNSIDFSNKTALIRADLNVPIKDGKVVSDARIIASLPTIRHVLDQGGRVFVLSHLGRPTEGEYSDQYSLAAVAGYLATALGEAVNLVDFDDANTAFDDGVRVALLENVRFNVGEKKDDESLAKRYADLGDVFVMDAFGTAHRAQASTHGVIHAMHAQGKPCIAGLLLAQELDALGRALDNPAKPMLAIVGGSKVSTKLQVLHSLADMCDHIIVGGGIANTFLAAQGHKVGASLYEQDLLDDARKIMQKTNIVLPKRVVVAKKDDIDFDDFIASLERATPIMKAVHEIGDDEMILDMDSQEFVPVVQNAKTILWNGPVGVFEADGFAHGTKVLADAISQSTGFSIAGGGDTLSAIDQFNAQVDYASTGGGAFLEFVEGKRLPAVVALRLQ